MKTRPADTDRRAQTRRKILDAASRVLRREGYAGAGVDALAAEAGLTSGAIYSHFKGKRDVLTEVVKRAVSEHEAVRERGLEDLTGDEWVRGMLRRYLSPEHHAAIEIGCPIPALVSELGRAGDEPRRAFAEAVERVVQRMEQKWQAADERAADQTGEQATDPAVRRRAMAGLAMAVGGIALARAVGDDKLAAELLDACRGQGVDAIIGGRPAALQERASIRGKGR